MSSSASVIAPVILDQYDVPPSAPADRLERIRALGEEARSLEFEMRDLGEQSRDLQARLTRITRQDLPELMSAARVPLLKLDPEGNYPARVFRLDLTAQASIPAGWPDERRRAAFEELERCQAGDLIQTTVCVDFPREKREEAKNFMDHLRSEHGLRAYAVETVHHSRLTAWLKRLFREGEPLPDLEKIGGWAGTVVRIEEPKT